MRTVIVRFADGPANGDVRELPADPDGAPPARWVLTERPDGAGPDPALDRTPRLDHLYERGPRPDGGVTWTMHWVRTDPVGMSE